MSGEGTAQLIRPLTTNPKSNKLWIYRIKWTKKLILHLHIIEDPDQRILHGVIFGSEIYTITLKKTILRGGK